MAVCGARNIELPAVRPHTGYMDSVGWYRPAGTLIISSTWPLVTRADVFERLQS